MCTRTLTAEQTERLHRRLISPKFGSQIAEWAAAPSPTSVSYRLDIAPSLIIRLMMDAGLRIGEARAAVFGALSGNVATRGAIHVDGAANHTARSRIVPLPTDLHLHLCMAREGWTRRTHTAEAQQPVCGQYQGRPTTTRTIRRWVEHETLQAFGEAMNPHALRHTYATRMLKVADIRVVQELLGHANVSSTQIYTHVTSPDLREAVDRMAAAGP